MAKCLNFDCSNEVVSQEGKRQKKTCSDSCRQKVWQRNKQSSKYIKVTIEQWKEMLLKATIGVPKKEVVIRVKGKEEWERLTTIENNILKKVIEKTDKPMEDNSPYTETKTFYDSRLKMLETYDPLELGLFPDSVPLQNKKEFRFIMKGESGLDYSMAKREWKLNNQ